MVAWVKEGSVSRSALTLLVLFSLSTFTALLSPLFVRQVSAASSYSYVDSSITDSSTCAKAGGNWTKKEGGTAGQGDCLVQSTPAQNVDAFMWAAWFSQCFIKRAADKGFSSDEIVAVDFDYGTDMNYGFAGSGDGDGKYECQTGNVNRALNALGFSGDFMAFLDHMGCTKSDGGTGRECGNLLKGGSVGTDIMNKMLRYRYVTTPTMDGATKYEFYLETLIRGCSATVVDKPTSAELNDANSTNDTSKHVLVPIYNPATGKMEDKVFALGDGLDKGRAVEPAMNGLLYPILGTGKGSPNIGCGTLANKARQHSGDYLIWAKAHTLQATQAASNQTGAAASGSETSACTVKGIGWIVCPVMNFIGEINDAAFAMVSSFLVVKPELLSDPDTKAAWDTFRNIANICFVIAFLFIIYSQVTSVGISNYGLKRLLPKLIVAAILVNVSYYLCQIAVDLSNIVGSSLYGFFKDIPTSAAGGASTNLPLWKTVIGVALAATAAAAAALLLASVLGTAALLAFALVIVILVARKAALVLLIVISPLAFVAYLLPNTESWFKKWWKLFSTLLMVFPMVSLIFGASYLAARIISHGDSSLTAQLTALAITALPLFALPTVLKGATAGLGAVGAKLNGMQNKAMGNAGKKGQERYKNTAFARGRELRSQNKDAYKTKKFAQGVAGTDQSWLGRQRGRAARGITGRTFTKAGGEAQSSMESKALASVTALENKEYAEGVEVARQAQQSKTSKQLVTDVIENPDSSAHEKSAAVERIMSTGSFDERQSVLKAIIADKAAKAASPDPANYKSAFNDSQVTTSIQSSFSKGDGDIYGKNFGNDILDGKISDPAGLEASAVKNAENNKVTAEHWAANGSASKWLAETVSKTANMAARANLKGAAAAARTPGSTTESKIGGDHKAGEALL